MVSANRNSLGTGFLAAGITAALVYFGTGLFPHWPLMWLAPLPILLFAQGSSWWAAGICAFLGWAIGALNAEHFYRSVLHLPTEVQVEIVAGPALIFAIAVLLFRWLLRRGAWWASVLAFPAAITSFEYLLNLNSPHGTFGSLAYSQLDFLPFLQLASLTGPWGMTFFLLLFSSGIAVAIYLEKKDRTQGRRILGASLGVIVIVLIFGAVRLVISPSGPTVKVGLVASDGAQNQGVVEAGAKTERLLQDYIAQAEGLAQRGADVIVMPEKIGVLLESDKTQVDAMLQSLVDRRGVVVIVGVVDVAPPVSYNQARVYMPQSAVATYNKHHMLPPFELPFRPGTSLLTFNEPSGTWGVEICKDMDFTRLSRAYGERGAGLILVPAWDFVLDRFQHGHIAIMRGVEDGFSIARAARQGYLTIADNRGRVLAETRSDSAPVATLLAEVPVGHETTIYLLLGDWFAWFAIGILAFSCAQLFRVRRGKSSTPADSTSMASVGN